MTTVTQHDISVYELGADRLEINVDGLTDREVLQELADVFPQGINVLGTEGTDQAALLVWLNPSELLGLLHPDGFGLEAVGIAHTACELIRMAVDTDRAYTMGSAACNGMIRLFTIQARDRASSKKINQLHAYRWGCAAKVTTANRVAPGTFEYMPGGKVEAQMALATGLDPDDIAYEWFVFVRHPYIGAIVLQAIPNVNVTKNTVMLNDNDHRRSNLGDIDGDGVSFFHVPSIRSANLIKSQLNEVVPENDGHMLVLGIAATETEAAMWGENIFADKKTTASKMAMTFSKTIDQWIDTHARMGELANKFTPFAYRISDVCAQLAGLGLYGAQEAAVMGATLEEVFYLGLTGGPEALDDALETWFRKKLNRANQGILFDGLRTVVDPMLLTTQTKEAIIRGSKINTGRYDQFDPTSAIAKFGFLIGKGRTTVGFDRSDKLSAGERLDILTQMAGDPDVAPEIRDTLLAKMSFYAARKLHGVVRDWEPLTNGDEYADGHDLDADVEYMIED